MNSVIFKNDAVGDLIHSLQAIENVTSTDDEVTIFISKLSQNFSFLLNKPNVNIRILNYNLSFIEKIKITFFLFRNNIKKVYILSPKRFYYFLPIIFKKKKFYAICINSINGYNRPSEFFRKFLYKYEINDRGKIFKRPSIKLIQHNLTSDISSKNKYNFNLNLTKSKILEKYLPDNYIYFHYKKKIFDSLNWKLNELYLLFEEFKKYCSNIIITKDIEIDNNNELFKQNFNSYDFKSKEFINKKKDILFLDNIVGRDLFETLRYSQKIVASHGMMTSIGYLLNKPVLDLFHCKINSWEDYRKYRNSFYEFKPSYKDYDFIIPKKDIKKTIKKMRFSLKKCKII